MCTHLLFPAVDVGFALAAPSKDVRNTGGPKGRPSNSMKKAGVTWQSDDLGNVAVMINA